MVMEAPPSPQSVGREFVRQYYTLLNKAPNHLHRFYNNQSSFVHGGLEDPNAVIGQKQIHQKIQQLNFRDCHAKITQVDSQATLGNGVVVQVTGELSNAGQPMRRFTQTFVLASQTPKKYYVHNDIFRYQDVIISDEEGDADNRSESEDDGGQECQMEQQPPMGGQPPLQYNYAPVQPNLPPVVQGGPIQGPQGVVLQGGPVVAQQLQQPQVNGIVHQEEMNMMAAAPVPAVVAAPVPINNIPPPSALMQGLNQVVDVVEAERVVVEGNMDAVEEIGVYNDSGVVEQQEVETHDLSAEPVTSNEPKTYANLLKSGNNTVPYNSPPHSAPLQAQVIIPRSVSPPLGGPRGDQLGNRNSINRGPRINNNQQRIQKQDSGRGAPGRNSFNEDDDKRRPQGNSYGDTNQLFLGNLPHNATEEELREIFNEFGAILDLRVHSKPANKTQMPGGRAPPNYGFITYDSQSGVQACLAAKPIFYPKNDKSGTQLNVEEKKVKERQSYGGGRPNSNDNRNRDRDNGPRRNGPGGGGLGGGNNRNNTNNGGNAGIAPNRTNSYNRGGGGGGGGGGPPNRGPNTYNNRR